MVYSIVLFAKSTHVEVNLIVVVFMAIKTKENPQYLYFQNLRRNEYQKSVLFDFDDKAKILKVEMG